MSREGGGDDLDPMMEELEGANSPPPDNLVLLPGAAMRVVEVEEGAAQPETGRIPEHWVEPALEAMLLASEGPQTEEDLHRWLGEPGPALVREALESIQQRLRQRGGGFQLVQVAKGWQLRTDLRFSAWVAAMKGARPVRLSKAAVETLAVVAYRQPITRHEVELLRGVECGGVLRMLCERGLVTPTGRKDEPGRPLLYGTTPDFLNLFGLRDLSELPTLRDRRELVADDPREEPGAAEASADDEPSMGYAVPFPRRPAPPAEAPSEEEPPVEPPGPPDP